MTNDTDTLTLAAFLERRLAEDEQAALAASPAPWQFGGVESVAGGTLYDATRRIADVAYEQPGDHDGSIVRNLLVPEANANGTHIARHDPARVLAEVAANRAVLTLAAEQFAAADAKDPQQIERSFNAGAAFAMHNTLRHLASVYSDHADYRDEWRP